MRPTSLVLAAVALATSSLALAAAPGQPAAASTPVAQQQVSPTAGLSDRAMSTETPQRPQTRDWARVDANGDHLVSPEEMTAYLKANPGPLNPASSR